METPSSIRRITRSQATNKCIPMSSNSTKTASRQTKVKIDRSALIDITNDSPIVGLAMGSIGTPSSLIKKKDQQLPKQTPGSGEALLRGQVKILLQKVEEEADISKIGSAGNGGGPLKGSLIYSPSGLLAPTPTNTPQVPDLSDIDIAAQVNQESVEVEIHQDEEMLIEELENSNFESERSDVTRALLFDFLEKSEISSDCSSVVTEGSVCRDKLTEEDDASVWSIQVNASARDEDEEEEEEEDFQEEEVDENDEGGYGDFGDGGSVDELCEGLSNIFLQKKPVSFEGKHTRFVYNSDGEIEDEVVISDNSTSPGVLRLNGLPTPKGKHLRFPEEEEEEV